VGSIAQYVDPSLWAGVVETDVVHATFWLAVLQIIFINILLSGDNAVVIAMACRGLPPQQRLWGTVVGAGAAVLLRIVFGGIVAQLMLLPYLKLIGGVALFYVAARLLVPDEEDTGEVEAVAHLWRVAQIVVIADIVMSLDNIVAVAATAKGDIFLLAIGLTVSIPLIVAGAALIMPLLDRFPILVWAGAALLGWIAGDVVASDPAVQGFLTRAFGAKVASDVEFAAAGAGAYLVVAAGGLWRKLRHRPARADAA
jgi:YjbE family integral membrane protein